MEMGPPNSGHEVPNSDGGRRKTGEGVARGDNQGISRGPNSCVCLAQPSLSSSGSRPSYEAKLCEQMVLLDQGPRRNLLRQAGQRVCPQTCQVCREPGEGQIGTGPALGDQWMLRTGETGLPSL